MLVVALHHATEGQKAQRASASSSKGTTHVSVIDADGMVASMTTSNGSCSGVLVPGTGVQLNNVMGEDDLHPDGFHAAEPGTRVASMMAPSLLDLADGSVVAIGQRRQRTDPQRPAADRDAPGRRAPAGRGRSRRPGCTSTAPAVRSSPTCPDAGRRRARPSWRPINRWSRRDLYFGGRQRRRRIPTAGWRSARRRHAGVGSALVVDL